MDFSQVINQSLTSVQKDCWNLAVGGKIMSPFWFNELLADIASFQGAMSKTVSFCDSHEKPMFKAITKSMEVEFQAIIESAKQLVEIDLESTAPYLTEEERQMNIHLNRLLVKGRYLMTHLKNFFPSSQLSGLGEDFYLERESLSHQMHAMAEGV